MTPLPKNVEDALPVAPTPTPVDADQGTANDGTDPWPVCVTENGTNTKVRPGDVANQAVRVNVVAGGGGGNAERFTDSFPSDDDGPTHDLTSAVDICSFLVEVSPGAATSFSVILYVSTNGINWVASGSTVSDAAPGAARFNSPIPCRYFRISAQNLDAAIDVTTTASPFVILPLVTDPATLNLLIPTRGVVTEVVPGIADADLGKEYGGTATPGQTGVAMFGRRNDGGATMVADGKWGPFWCEEHGGIVLAGLVAIGVAPKLFKARNITPSPMLTGSDGAVDSFTATAAAQSAQYGVGGDAIYKFFTLQVIPTGAVTSWDVRLNISLNGVVFGLLLTHTSVTPGTGGVIVSVAAPCLAWEVRVAGLVLGAGTNIVIKSLASS